LARSGYPRLRVVGLQEIDAAEMLVDVEKDLAEPAAERG
jgi:hypothetical protein